MVTAVFRLSSINAAPAIGPPLVVTFGCSETIGISSAGVRYAITALS